MGKYKPVLCDQYQPGRTPIPKFLSESRTEWPWKTGPKDTQLSLSTKYNVHGPTEQTRKHTSRVRVTGGTISLATSTGCPKKVYFFAYNSFVRYGIKMFNATF